MITLDRVTRLDAASDFFGEQYVPRRAMTMGVGTIMDARRVILMAFGEHKRRLSLTRLKNQSLNRLPRAFCKIIRTQCSCSTWQLLLS